MSKNILKILLVLTAILLVACGGKTISSEDKVQKLRYGIAAEITQINPLLNEEGHSEIDGLLFRGLMQPTETNEVKGDLAIDWKISKDLLEYQFTLRKDAFWQDDQRLTAHDVKFTLDKIRDPSINSPSQSEFRLIKEVTVVSDYVLQIELTEPFPALLNKLKIGIVPKHLLEHENMNKTTFSRNPVGNGPYQLKEWGIDNTIILTRNEKYYGPSPQIDEVLFIPVPDENTRLLQLKTGELHLAQLTPSQLNAISETDSFSVHEIPTADYRAVQYNMKLPIFQDARVR